MYNLVQLDLYNNSLTGKIPSGITHLKKLTFLSLARNNLTGEVPSDLGKNNSPGLVKLDLTANRLYGRIPLGICDGNRLSVLTIGSNLFNGNFPTEIAKCSSLRRVLLSNNLLQGSIPDNLYQGAGISYFEVRANSLTGRIPPALGFWSNLSMLDLSENRLSGPLPSELGKLKNLQILRVTSNRLTGNIPPELGHLSKLIKLDLSKNFLSGSIPSDITMLEELQSLLLEENKLTGAIPDSFSSSQSLFELKLGNNMLERDIPCSLSKPQNFNLVLNLSNNRLIGKIPGCIGKLDKLQTLDLSNNNLSGEIPPELNNMISLSFVNISFNHLSGKLPAKWLKLVASNPGYSLGNPELCLPGNEAGNCGEARKSNARGMKLSGIAMGAVFSVVTLCSVLRLFLVQGLRESRDQSLLRDFSSKIEDLPDDLSFEDIMRATKGRSQNCIIGRGKHGTVYRTESGHSRRQWAVKKVNLSESNFSLKMKTLSLVRHRNILRMAGYCIKDGFGFIVMEYMPAGTLFDVLHHHESHLILNWDSRYRIAFGIAQALSYLHHDCVPRVIHRDIKSENILMDSELEPKIGDFGLAKLGCDFDASSTRSSIVGTLGYIAPGQLKLFAFTSESSLSA
ncbi:probable leucine-rich repeat receptor-like protein kinase At5g63930 [Malania oleifera]|uniref:probable leucine-rich repeat receptor-like protein kinase At5g63930 n=1 Tax=Malania oleifera TaxID=397392 RepID=UPI0025AE7A00|nr:probable leucine-rich repeat receptor-like protein kinase At5g63930 [Malania oleifera]